jgi:hypothetical protein
MLPAVGGHMRLVPFLFLAVGCYADVQLGGGTAGDPDDDNDGLPLSQEEELGTDPAVADTDGDGHDDGVEFTLNADPLDPEHHPYAGGWPIGACRTEIVETGIDEGEVPANAKLLDQYGDTVHLYDFCDRTVYLLFAAFW